MTFLEEVMLGLKSGLEGLIGKEGRRNCSWPKGI